MRWGRFLVLGLDFLGGSFFGILAFLVTFFAGLVFLAVLAGRRLGVVLAAGLPGARVSGPMVTMVRFVAGLALRKSLTRVRVTASMSSRSSSRVRVRPRW